MTESAIAKASRDAIVAMGIPCTRVNAAGYRGRMRGAIPGTPDTWTALGWIEFKRPKGKLSPVQESWHARAKRWGVRVEVSESLEQTIAIVKRWLAEYEYERANGWR